MSQRRTQAQAEVGNLEVQVEVHVGSGQVISKRKEEAPDAAAPWCARSQPVGQTISQ